MRKLLGSLVLLFLLGTDMSLAQLNSDDAIVGRVLVNAQVIQSIELVTVNSMTFGSAQPGQRELYVNPINDANAGFMIAIGTPGLEFRLDYLNARRLTNVEGEGFLTFTYEISGNDIEDQDSSELLNNDNRSIRFNNEGRYYLWVGGRVNLENAQPGSYEGDFSIEIDYI